MGKNFSRYQNILISYSIKTSCSRMIQWSFISFSSPKDIPQKNSPMFYSNSNGDKNYVI